MRSLSSVTPSSYGLLRPMPDTHTHTPPHPHPTHTHTKTLRILRLIKKTKLLMFSERSVMNAHTTALSPIFSPNFPVLPSLSLSFSRSEEHTSELQSHLN